MRRLVIIWLVYFVAILAILAIGVLAGQIAHAQSFDWKPTIAASVGTSLDTVSTYRCGGEKNPQFQVNGDWRQPDYGKMWRANVIGVATLTALSGWVQMGRQRHPDSRVLNVTHTLLKTYGYGIGVWRGAAGVRNIYRCGW